MTDVIIGGIFVFLVGTVLTMQSSRIAKKANKELMEERHIHYMAELVDGVKKFEKIDERLTKLTDEQVEQGKVLIKVYTSVTRMEKNGGSRPK